MPRFAGHRVLVTGGASGIGEATCRLFAAEGATVTVLDRNDEACGIRVADGGGWPAAVVADVRDADGGEPQPVLGMRPRPWAVSPTWSTTPALGHGQAPASTTPTRSGSC
jgi:NAD(P)-dependent dehydrogenase (short-subunit alcohol dehydrogenase family)